MPRAQQSRTLKSVMKCECRHLHLKCKADTQKNQQPIYHTTIPTPSIKGGNKLWVHLCMEHPNPKHGKVGLQVLACLQIQQWLHNQQKRRCNKIELHKYINHGVNWRMKYILPWTQVHVLDIYMIHELKYTDPKGCLELMDKYEIHIDWRIGYHKSTITHVKLLHFYPSHRSNHCVNVGITIYGD